MISNVITALEFYIVFVKKHVNICIDDELILWKYQIWRPIYRNLLRTLCADWIRRLRAFCIDWLPSNLCTLSFPAFTFLPSFFCNYFFVWNEAIKWIYYFFSKTLCQFGACFAYIGLRDTDRMMVCDLMNWWYRCWWRRLMLMGTMIWYEI